MNYVVQFLKGKWLMRAAKYLASPAKMRVLLECARRYSGRKGLAEVKEELNLIVNFVSDVVKGRYKDYSRANLLLAVAAIIYVVSPIDLVPDFVVGMGLLDDVTIVAWALTKMGGEISRYRKAICGGDVPAAANPD
ncbi:MAG: YkvA family protein [Muribaculaceae bacterium]